MQYLNKKHNLKGHLWQGRFFSSILDERHLYAAVRYVEQNPVRAGLVNNSWDWKWSSARAHANGENCGLTLADISPFIKIGNWIDYLSVHEEGELIKKIRKNTLAGKPSADGPFINHLERILGVDLTSSKRGRTFGK